MTDVAILYGGREPHPVHREFAESVGADLIRVPQFTLGTVFRAIRDRPRFFYPQYDVLITEGTGALEAGIANTLFNDTTLIFLAGGHGIHLLDSESKLEVNSNVKSAAVNAFPGVIQSLLSRNIDGVIAVSDLAAELTCRVIGPDIPTRVIHPYINDGLYDRLLDTTPDLSNKEVVTVCKSNQYKGVDLLVSAWERVIDKVPDATLHIVGAGHPEEYGYKDGIKVHGYVEDLIEIFSYCTLYVQPSRIDTFPVSTLEAMASGLPTVVTNRTGTLSEVQKVDSSLITAPDPTSLAQAITHYFSISISQRQKISEQFRNIGSRFKKHRQCEEFERHFKEILNEVN